MDTQTSRPSFFKVLIGDFHNQLRIPTVFIKNFDGIPPTKSNIRSPCGKYWAVELEKDEDGFFFRSGWKEFVKHNSLEYGDFIVFKYNGKSEFAVKIFGTDACEKQNLACQATVSIEESQPQNLKDSNKRKTSTSNIQNRKKTRAKRKCDDNDSEAKKGNPDHKTGNSERKTRISNKGKGESEMKRRKLDEIKKSDLVPRSAHFFKSENSCFMANISASSMYHIAIPKKLVREKKLEKHSKMELGDPTGRQWTVKLFSRLDGRMEISAGWNAFCKGNMMETNDTVIFEFIGHNVVQVHIFRAGAGAIALKTCTLLDAA